MKEMNENDDILQSKVIDLLRFPLMLGVVVIHCRFTDRLQPMLLENVVDGGGISMLVGCYLKCCVDSAYQHFF